MSFIACQHSDYELWNYIQGNIYEQPTQKFRGIYKKGTLGMSILNNRFKYLDELNNTNEIKISLHDHKSNYWTKWDPFPGQLFHIKKNEYGTIGSTLTPAIDVHRSMQPNEIVIESDYKTYEENYEATKIIGTIIEKKGFTPHYYFSGNKSIHCHVFLDWTMFKTINTYTKIKLINIAKGSIKRFKKKFIIWLRTLMINCWDTHAKTFDSDLINASHLIRCELSKNKKGFKTFLGYTHKDISYIPYICNENNKIYPRLGTIKLSRPNCFSELIDKFINSVEDQDKKLKRLKYNQSLNNWVHPSKKNVLKCCAQYLLSDDFKNIGDGLKRGMFILLNELRNVNGDIIAKKMILDWSSRMDFVLRESDLDYNLSKKVYFLSHNYIHSFFKSLNFNISGKCNGKV